MFPPTGQPKLTFDALSFDEAGFCTASGVSGSHDVGVTTDGGASLHDPLNDYEARRAGRRVRVPLAVRPDARGSGRAQLIFVYDTRTRFTGHTFAVDNVSLSFPSSANPSQSDLDHDGLGDVCDPCPLDAAERRRRGRPLRQRR